MFVQTEITPNPNSLKFLPGKIVSNHGSFEITKKDETNNELIRNLLSINGVEGIFLGKDFISINKFDDTSWEEIKHIVISLINDFYSSGKDCVVEKDLNEEQKIHENFKITPLCSQPHFSKILKKILRRNFFLDILFYVQFLFLGQRISI